MAAWIKCGTRGVRCREHPTRRHGVRKDRYFAIRYQADGIRHEEGLGWASEGWTERKATAVLAELIENHRRGSGPRTLKEKRAIAEAKRQEQAEKEARARRENISFGEVFLDHFIPHVRANRRRSNSYERDLSLYLFWIGPALGDKPLKAIVSLDCERIKRNMANSGRAARSIEYALAVVRAVFNYAIDNDLFVGKNPAGRTLKRPKVDNKRVRYLTRQEAADLLSELANRSKDVHDLSLLSLNTGMRAGEVFGLTWADIDLDAGTILLKDTKSNRNRTAFINTPVREMFESRPKGQPFDLVFPSRNGKRIKQASDSFGRAVTKLGLNSGITDRRQKVTFHTLRHTFASWLVEGGTDIYLIQKLLGHSDLTLTARYAHVGNNQLRAAVDALSDLSQKKPKRLAQFTADNPGI